MRRNPNEDADNSDKNPPLLKLVDSCLRFCVVPLSVATIWLTVTNHQDNPNYGKLEYSSIMGLKYPVWINAICAGYALVAAVSSWVRCLVTRAWLFFVPDQVVAYLMVTSVSTISEIMYLAYKGDQEVTWSEACSSYGKFCYKIKIALVLHGLALGCFVVLAVISAYRVFSIFEPPCVSSEEIEEQRN